jgi:DNA-binding LacI/PurR family transcriptional regulator/GAF domain-containing protein
MPTTSQKKSTPTMNNRPTIGFIIDDISLGYQQTLWQGVVTAANDHQINLITLIGGAIQGDEPFSDQENVVYGLVNPEIFAGLIIASGTIFKDSAAASLQYIQDTFPPIPAVSIALEIEKIPSLLINNHSGMYQAVSHLIEAHGYRKIAFIQQYAGNLEAEARYQAYAAALKDHKVELVPNWVVPPNFDTDPAGAVATLLKERQVEIDAIVCVDDSMAIEIIGELQSYNLQVPQDIAIVGFDNIEESNFSSPPMTTVHQPIQQQGQLAVKLLLDQIEGKTLDPRILLDTELVLRQSCGCMPLQQHVTISANTQKLFEISTLDSQKKELSENLNHLAEIPANEAWATLDLLAAFSTVIDSQDEAAFTQTVNHIFTRLQAQAAQLHRWQDTLQLLRQNWLMPKNENHPMRAKFETWLYQTLILLNDIALRSQMQQRLTSEQATTTLREWGQALTTSVDTSNFREILINGLPLLGIPSFGMVLYPDNEPQTDQFQVDLAFTAGQISTETMISRTQLIPSDLLPLNRNISLVLRPIYFQNTNFGYTIFEVGAHTGSQYINMSEYISSGLHSLRLSAATSAALNRANILNIVSQRLRNVTSVTAAVKAAVDGAVAGTQADIVVISTINSADQTVGHVTTGGPRGPKKYIEAEYDELWDGLSGLALQELETVFSPKKMIPDPRENSTAQERRGILGAGSIIIAPLHYHGETLGTMTLINQTDSADFTRQELDLTTAIANQASGAIMNARLFENMQTSLDLNERRSAQLSAAAQVADAISTILEIEEMLPQVVDVIRERFNLYYVGLFLVEGEQKWAELQAGTGQAGQEMIAQNWKLEVGGNSMIGRCIENGTTDIQLEVEQAPIHLRNPFLPDTRSEMALPLTSRGDTFGAVTIQSTTANAFTPEDAASLITMANQIANAIQNTRLYEQSQTALAELESTQRRYLTQAWSEFTKHQAKSGYQRENTQIIPLGNQLLPEVQEAMKEKRSVVLQDDEGNPTILAVPVLLRDEPIGALGFSLPPEKDSWTPDDISVAEAVSDQFGLAAETLRLLDTTQRRAARERLVTEITTKIRATTDPEAMLQTAASELREALQAQRAQVIVQSKEPGKQ